MVDQIAGIASQGMAQEAQPQQAQPQQAQSGQSSGGFETEVTPEEQQAFDQVSTAAMSVVFENEESHNSIMQSLKAGTENPAETIAQIVVSIFSKIDKDSGGKMPVTIMYGAVEEIADQVMELAESSGVMQFDEATKGQIAQQIVMKFGEAYDIPPEEIQELTDSVSEQELQTIVQDQDKIAGGGNVQV